MPSGSKERDDNQKDGETMIQLSNSKISVFRDCPRCFWFQEVRKIPRPRGIFPSLPGGMDSVLKKWYDQHRANGTVPQEIAKQVPPGSYLFRDQAKIDKYRNWRSGIRFTVAGVQISGALDDILVMPDDTVSPFDYKTRGWAPKAGAPDYYGPQLDLYTLALRHEKYTVNDFGYLAYYWPSMAGTDVFDTTTDGTVVTFDVEVEKKSVSPFRAEDLIQAAKECLEGEIPIPSPACEYCSMTEARAWETR